MFDIYQSVYSFNEQDKKACRALTVAHRYVAHVHMHKHKHAVAFSTRQWLCPQCFAAVSGGSRGQSGHAPPKMPNIVQHDTETTQSWCALQ